MVALNSIKVGGDTFDAAITARLRHDYFGIGVLTAERLKIERGYAGRPPGRDPYVIAGSDMRNLAPARRARPARGSRNVAPRDQRTGHGPAGGRRSRVRS